MGNRFSACLYGMGTTRPPARPASVLSWILFKARVLSDAFGTRGEGVRGRVETADGNLGENAIAS